MESLVQYSNHSIGPANQLFGLLVQTMLAAHCTISPPNKWPADFGPTIIENGLIEYDFIIVGAGSAGSVMASRLSENPAWNVLLLEAGGDPPIESEIPAMFNSIQQSEYDWGYFTERSTTGGLSTKSSVYWPRGKMLGGTSGINAMVYVRGNRRDYDQWAVENSGWDYASVLQYFRKSEDNGVSDIMSDKYHGRGGPLKVNHMQDVSPVRAVLKEAVLQMGESWVDDINGESALGFTNLQATTENGERCSTAKAFLVPAMERQNLHIVKHAHVTKLHFDNEAGMQVNGVEFQISGHKDVLTARTSKEVILSAGALNSPQILQLSGIGPAKHLESIGIPVLHDLPVGENLQDHLFVPYFMTLHTSTAEPFSFTKAAFDYIEYATNRTGTLATVGTCDFVGFVSTLGDSEYPDIQYHGCHFERQDPAWAGFLHKFNFNDEIKESLMQANEEGQLILWIVVLLNPRSRGNVQLRSSDPFDAPRLTHNYFAEPDDVQTVVKGIRRLQKIEATAVFREHEGEAKRPILAACDHNVEDSDEYWQCYVRHITATLYHPVGTVKMGANPANGAVVDAQLRVHGVGGLRVVDASIMPSIVSGNTNAPVIMIGEKGADLVKEAYAPRAERQEL